MGGEPKPEHVKGEMPRPDVLVGGLSGCMNLHVMTSLPLNIRRAQCLDWGGDTTSVFVCE